MVPAPYHEGSGIIATIRPPYTLISINLVAAFVTLETGAPAILLSISNSIYSTEPWFETVLFNLHCRKPPMFLM